MQPIDYTIPRMQMPDLGQAFMRGIQIRDMFNAQNAQKRNEEVKSEFGKLLNQYGSAGEALKNLKSSKYAADLYEPLSNAYQMEVQQSRLPLDMETAKLGLTQLKNKQLQEFSAPLIKEFLKRSQGERLDAFQPTLEALKNTGMEINPQWVEQGYTPEVGQQLEMMSSLSNATQDGDSDIRKYQYFKDLTPEEQNRFLLLKRAQQMVNTGAEIGVVNPLTQEVKKVADVTLKPGEQQKINIAGEKLDLERQKNEREVAKATREDSAALEKHKQMMLAKESEIESMKQFSGKAKNLFGKDLKGNYGATKVGRLVPGTEWANISAEIDNLVNSGVIQSMMEMKRNSPTGSTGFGALSEKEMGVIQSAFSILNDRNITPEKAKEALKQIYTNIDKYISKIEKYNGVSVDTPGVSPKKSSGDKKDYGAEYGF